MAGVKNVVLVHGAWADGSCWSKVVPILIAKGLHAVAVQNPLSSVADDVASTNRLVELQDGPVLLVGQSYGGAVITEAGNNPKVAGMVYVAAFAPEEGETLGGLAQGFPPPPLFKEIQPIADGYLMLNRNRCLRTFWTGPDAGGEGIGAGGTRRYPGSDPGDADRKSGVALKAELVRDRLE